MKAARAYWTALAALLAAMPAAAHAADYTLVVTAPNHDYRNVPVTVVVPTPQRLRGESGSATVFGATLKERGRDVLCQARLMGDKAELRWIVPELKKGQSRSYTADLWLVHSEDSLPAAAVEVKPHGADVDVSARGQLIARYDVTTGPNKPYLYPLYGPGGKLMVRHYPIEKVVGETNDHPHHRGLWFTHGAVNGVDYWSEGGKTGKTVHRDWLYLAGGPVCGRLTEAVDWIDPDGRKVATDVRNLAVYDLPEGRILDYAVTITPEGGPLTFGDTKEGSFGLRLPDSMRVGGGDGHIITSEGVRDRAAWSTRANWVDYYGTVEGETMGVAIMDDPQNPRHPTYWHVRDYGLFAANPFGIHDFVKGQPAGAGNLVVEAGKTLTFRYRVLLHKGTTDDAHVAEQWAAYADPPKVEIRKGR